MNTVHYFKRKDTQEFKHLVEVMTLPQALSEPEHAELAVRVLRQHYHYMMEGDKVGGACALCVRPWTLKFSPASLLHVTPLQDGKHVVSLVCYRCATDRKLTKKLLKQLKDLGYDFHTVTHMRDQVGVA